MLEVVERGDWSADVEEHAGIAARRFRFLAGQVMPGHKHPGDHATVVIRGELLLIVVDDNGERTEDVKRPGDFFTILGQSWHQVRAVTDCEWLCIASDLNALQWIE